MKYPAYEIYKEFEEDKYKTSTEEKVARALAGAKKEGLAPNKEGIGFEEAREILGKDFLGLEEIEAIFGFKPETVPNIPFTEEELERAKELGQQLILQTDTMELEGEKVPLTLLNLKKKFTKSHDDKKVFYSQDWYNNEDFWKNEKPRLGWRLTSSEVIPDSTSKNYLDQTDLIVEHLTKEVFKDASLPKEYADAISEFKKERPKIADLMKPEKEGGDRQKASQALVDLKITKLTRELPVEAMFRLILNEQARKDKPLPLRYTWTGRRASGGNLVIVGDFDDDGADVDDDGPRHTYDTLGVCFSRM